MGRGEAEKTPPILIQLEQHWGETRKQKKPSFILVEVSRAFLWILPHEEEKPKSSPSPSCPHFLSCPPWSLCSSHVGLSHSPHIHQAHSCPRAFARAIHVPRMLFPRHSHRLSPMLILGLYSKVTSITPFPLCIIFFPLGFIYTSDIFHFFLVHCLPHETVSIDAIGIFGGRSTLFITLPSASTKAPVT